MQDEIIPFYMIPLFQSSRTPTTLEVSHSSPNNTVSNKQIDVSKITLMRRDICVVPDALSEELFMDVEVSGQSCLLVYLKKLSTWWTHRITFPVCRHVPVPSSFHFTIHRPSTLPSLSNVSAIVSSAGNPPSFWAASSSFCGNLNTSASSHFAKGLFVGTRND